MSLNFRKIIQLNRPRDIWNINKSCGSYLVNQHNKKFIDFYTDFTPLGWNHPSFKTQMQTLSDDLFINKSNNFDSSLSNHYLNAFNSIVPDNFNVFFDNDHYNCISTALNLSLTWKSNFNSHNSINLDNLHILHLNNFFNSHSISHQHHNTIHLDYFDNFLWSHLDYNSLIDNVDDTLFNLYEYNLNNHKNNNDIYECCLHHIDDQLFKINSHNVAALIVSPVQFYDNKEHIDWYILKLFDYYCKKNNIIFIFDEFDSGFYSTGKSWAFQHFDIHPDIVLFGKNSQHSGFFYNHKFDSLIHNYSPNFNLIDLIRSTIINNIILNDHLDDNVVINAKYLSCLLNNLHSNNISNVKFLGGLLTFDLINIDQQDFLLNLYNYGLLVAPADNNSIRLTLNLNTTLDDIEHCANVIEHCLKN